MSDVISILSRIAEGDPAAIEQLLPVVYEELCCLAANKLKREGADQILQAKDLVHEAWLRLGADAQPHWQNRAHFFGAAAEAMRRILVERARRRLAAKRGGGAEWLGLDEIEIALPIVDDALLRVDDALEKLAAIHPRKADLVKLRYFVGMTYEEAAAVLMIAIPTAKQWWAEARAWLSVELRNQRAP